MNAIINISKASGKITAPPSKSMAHRLLICAALCNGFSKIYNIELSQDILATLDCISAFGATYKINDDYIEINGINFNSVNCKVTANCRESGSTLRFFIPLALLTGTEVTLSGSEYLFSRPLTVYEEIFKQDNIDCSLHKNKIVLNGILKSREYFVPGNVSSQFISGLLFALPLLKNSSKIIITKNIESRSYINLTISALKKFGVNAQWLSDNEIFVEGGQKYSPCNVFVEGDYSNAAFFEALNVFGGDVLIEGLNENSLQGDKIFYDYFNKIVNGYNEELDLSNCPDLAPVLFTVAAFKGGAVFSNTARLKIKESNRAECMAKELEKFGAKLIIEENKVTVLNTKLHKPNEILNSHNDHRIVMSLSVLCTMFGGTIIGAEAVNKSFPQFFNLLKN
ncbi:MAG: 3-phosphoshikimate 1-carboxyvinyltransferase [Clostridia bacterium]|nr:3-phosphoshikimate 1-carboxyvinyltransferase [Clostridia bacterium]